MSAGCAQDERIESDIPAADRDWRTMRFPVTSAGSQTVAGRTDILFLHHEESLLEWGLEMRSVLDNSRVSPLLAAICEARTMLKELKTAFKSKSALEAFASAPEEPQVTVPSNLLQVSQPSQTPAASLRTLLRVS